MASARKFNTADVNDLKFLENMKQELRQYFDTNHFTRFATLGIWAKAVFFFVGYLGCWSALCFWLESPLAGLAFCLFMGFFGTGIALNIGHESSHNVYSRHSWVNKFLYYFSMNLLGTYHHIWRLGHLQTHHTWVNVGGLDVGVDGGPLIRLNPQAPLKSWHRFQHFYAPALYCFYTLLWTVSRDWKQLIKGEIAGIALYQSYSEKWRRYFELFILKAFYFFYILYLPLKYSHFNNAQILTGFVLMHVFFSLYLASLLFTSHLTTQVEFHKADKDGTFELSFLRHQLSSTMDVNPQSSFASFCLGGFNTHVVHHIYPHVSSAHYPALTKILKNKCRQFHYPYIETDFFSAVVSHFSFLKLMGSQKHLAHSTALKMKEAISLS